MSLGRILHVVGLFLIFVALAMAVAGGVSLLYSEGDSFGIFLAAGITLAFGWVAVHFTSLEGDVTVREGFATVSFAWTATAIFGSLPYLFTGAIDSVIPAVFESMSGFTTTGATILGDIESLPHGILFWRSLTQWLGGMGIIVLAIAILPFLGFGGMQLFRAEVPGPTPDRLRPRIAQTAKLLWYVYGGLTVAQVGLYLLGGMEWFDAVTHTFTTVATSGFSTKNESLGGFDSRYIQYVTIVFMYLAGMNFALHFRAATGRFLYFRDAEWRFFTALALGSALFLLVSNYFSGVFPATGPGIEEGVRTALFQAMSLTTTTGFVNADYELWSPAAQGLLVTLMFIGGMAGSTAGSMKTIRIILLLKHAAIQIRKSLHPRAILLARVGPKAIKEDVMDRVVGFVVLYLFLFMAGALSMTLFGMDLITALGASAATVGNIGPGIGDVGPSDNYGWMSDGALTILAFLMLVGRLEIYTVLLLFHPGTWRERKGRRR